MAKESGLGHYLFCGGFDLSGDVGMVDSIISRRNLLDVTGIDKSAPERISGLRDGEINFNSWFNPSASQEHPALSTLLTTDRLVQYHAGATVGQSAAGLNAKQVNYDPSRGADGSLALSVQALGNGSPVEWGEQLTTGKQTFASATNGTSIDYGAAIGSTAFGAVGYLQVFSVASGTATVAIQDSADNAAFLDVTGLVFTGATGQTQQRLATATGATIRRYLRVNVTGAFTNAVIAVVVLKFLAAQS
jgi:hypothetical protein